MSYVEIDGIPLLEPATPVGLDIVPSGFSEHPLPGGGMVVFEEAAPPTIILHFGLTGGISEDAQRILEMLRMSYGQHILGIQDLSCNRMAYFNVYIPRIPRNAQQLSAGEHLAFGTIDLPCKVLDLWPKLVEVELTRLGTLAVMDGADYWDPPAPGYIWSASGAIRNSGSGGGQTRIQLAQGLTDYLSTPGDFAAGGVGVLAQMANHALAGSVDFVAGGDPVRLDIDGLPGNSDSADVTVKLWVMLGSPA